MATSRISTATSRKRKPCTKCHWTHEEDELLTLLVQIHGPGKWDRIASHIPGRTGKSCRIRWYNQLNPRVNKMPFSAEEKRRLLELHGQYGNRWSTIVNYFPGRTDNQVKNQYHILAGTRYMKALGLSSSPDPRGFLEEGSAGLFPYQSISTVPIGSQFSDVSGEGFYYCGFAPYYLTAMPDMMEMGPSFIGSPSSVYGQGETFSRFAAHSSILSSLGTPSIGVNLNPHQRISCADSLISDANSAEVAELYSVTQPQQEVGIKGYQFIDFLGIGNSE